MAAPKSGALDKAKQALKGIKEKKVEETEEALEKPAKASKKSEASAIKKAAKSVDSVETPTKKEMPFADKNKNDDTKTLEKEDKEQDDNI